MQRYLALHSGSTKTGGKELEDAAKPFLHGRKAAGEDLSAYLHVQKLVLAKRAAQAQEPQAGGSM